MKSLLTLILVCICSFLFAQKMQKTNLLPGTTEVHQQSEFTQPQFFKFKEEYNLPVNNLTAWVNQNMKLGNDIVLKQTKTRTDKIGITHHRYNQTYQGIPVKAGIYNFHEKNGKIVSGNGKIFKLNLSTQPCIDATTALKTAEQHINAKQYKVNNTIVNRTALDLSQLPYPQLIIVSKNLNYQQPVFRLAWEVILYAVNPLSHDRIYVDATTGKVIAKENRICSIDAQGTAISKYNGTVAITTDSIGPNSFRLYESGRGGGIHTLNYQNTTTTTVDFTDTDNFWNNTNFYKDEAAADAHYGAEMTYDYFFQEHGRNSYDGNGAPLISRVHYAQYFENAFWDGSTTTYGDGSPGSFLDRPLTAIDVCGHEFTHGVTEHTAGLINFGESAALSESFSDIFGTAIEWFANPSTANWSIAERVTYNGLGIRNMKNPNELMHPDTYKGNYWGGGAHNNSGVQNYWFYLLVNGGSGTNDLGNSYNINPIGLKKASQVAFRNLTVYLTPSSTYPDARFYSIKAAEDLFGPCSPEVIEVINAWHAVGLGNPFSPAISADFTANKTTFCNSADSTTFWALGTEINTFFWDFGDGNTSTLSSPKHAYNQSGWYTVSLSVTGCNGVMDSKTKINYINVDPMSELCDTIVLPRLGAITSNACGGVVVDPGGIDGPYPNFSNVTFTIDPPGTTNIQVTFDMLNLEYKAADVIAIYDGPNTSSPPLGVFRGTVIPDPVVSTNGSLTIQFLSGSSSWQHPGFIMSWTDLSNGLDPVAAFNMPTIIHNWPFQLDNQSLNSGTFHWDFGDGTTSNVKNPTHFYSTPGTTYNTRLIASNCSGIDTIHQAISIGDPALISIVPDTICLTLNQGDTTVVPVNITNFGNGTGLYKPGDIAGSNIIFWDSKKQYFLAEATTTHNFHNIPSYIDTLYLTFIINGDFDNDLKYARTIIDGVNLGKILDNNVPNGTDITRTLKLSGNIVDDWLSDGSLKIQIENSRNVIPGSAGDDVHQVIIGYNTMEWVNYNTFNGYLAGNAGKVFDLLFDARNVAGGKTYVADVPIQTNNLTNPIENIHCKLTVLANPISKFSASDTVSCNGTLMFKDHSLNNPVSWYWDFGDGNFSTDQNPTHNYQNSGIYDVTLVACNGSNCDILTKPGYINYSPTAITCYPHTLPSDSSATFTGCTGLLFDNSGPNASYLNATSDTAYIIPAGAASITLTFNTFELEYNYDFLFVFDGPSTNSPLIGNYTGTTLPPTITSSGGALTIVMKTDSWVRDEGFEAAWYCTDTELDIHLWLEGAYDQYTGMMTTDLLQRNLLPTLHPYSGPPWNYTGTEGQGWTTSDYPTNAVDWVKVSFRTGITKNAEVATTAAVLLDDGSLFFPNSKVLNAGMGNTFYVVVEHRNHIGAMSAFPVTIANNKLTYDFRMLNSYTTVGAGQKEIFNGIWALYGGDGDQLTWPTGFDISGLDNQLWNPNNGISNNYLEWDYNLDGDINAADKIIWYGNTGIFSMLER